MTLSVLPKPYVAHTYIQHATYFPDLSLMITKQTYTTTQSNKSDKELVPRSPHSPRSYDFMCLTRVSASLRHVCCFYQMSCSPSASLVEDPFPPSIVLPPPSPVKSQSLFCSRRDDMTCRSYTTLSLNQSPPRVPSSLSCASYPNHILRKHILTGAALIGRRWADRQCRDRTVTVLHPPLQHLSRIYKIGCCAK